jgi:hypothetical protein
LVNRIIVLLTWAYALVFAAILGSGIPVLIESLQIHSEAISTGISLVFLAVPIILFLGVARSGWSNDVSVSESGFLTQVFGKKRALDLVRAIRPATLLMIAAGLMGVIGIANTFRTTQSPVAYCLSSYFLAVGLGHLYAYLARNRRRD